jgi:perosamine synthetase
MELAILGGKPTRSAKVAPLFRGTAETKKRIAEILDGGLLSDFYGGPICAEFEESFARSFGVSHAVAVNSGTAALHCAVAATGVGPGDEVLVPTACFFTAATAVIQQRAVPVLIDSTPGSLHIDLDQAADQITQRTRAVIAAHMYGHPGDLVALRRFADRHHLALIEDSCQAHGARFNDLPAGTVGDVGCFSFAAPRKHMNTGEGGMVVTNDPETARLVRQLANKGKLNGWYTHRMMGYSYSMPEICAIIGLQGLRELPTEVACRQAAAAEYDDVLNDSGLETDGPAPGVEHSYFRKVVLLPRGYEKIRDWMVRAIEAENVSAKPPHAALHTIPWLRDFMPFTSGDALDGKVVRSEFPVADDVLPRLLDMETGPGLSRQEARTSASAVAKVWQWVRRHHDLAFELAGKSGRYGA